MVRDAGGDQLGGGVVDDRHTVVADDFNLHVDGPSLLDPLGWGCTAIYGFQRKGSNFSAARA